MKNCSEGDGDAPSMGKVCLYQANVPDQPNQAFQKQNHQTDKGRANNGQADAKLVFSDGVSALDFQCPVTIFEASPKGQWLGISSALDLSWQRIRQICRECKLSVFVFCCTFIGLVGILDTWLVVKYSDSIFEMEQNPICLYLLQQDPEHFLVFVYGKSAGILTVLCVLIGLFRCWKRVAMYVTLAVTFFQFSLLTYLFVLSDIPHYYRVYIE